MPYPDGMTEPMTYNAKRDDTVEAKFDDADLMADLAADMRKNIWDIRTKLTEYYKSAKTEPCESAINSIFDEIAALTDVVNEAKYKVEGELL